jgi:hypothetical protein
MRVSVVMRRPHTPEACRKPPETGWRSTGDKETGKAVSVPDILT